MFSSKNRLAWTVGDLHQYGGLDAAKFLINRNPDAVLTFSGLKRDYRETCGFPFEEFKKKIIDPFKLHCLEKDSLWCDHKASYVLAINVNDYTNTVSRIHLSYFNDEAKDILKAIETNIPAAREETRVYLVTQGRNGYQLHDHEAKDVNVPLENYNMSIPFETTKKAIHADGSGFILFSGPPGTGKSFLIRKLMQESKTHKFVIVPSDLASKDIANPAFLSFLLDNFEDESAVLVIEDAETALTSREKFGNPAVTSVLNMSDGLLGDVFGFKILATINTNDDIDTALLRDGRCKAHVEFKNLNTAQINAVCVREGAKAPETQDAMSIASVYSHINKQKNELSKPL